MEIIRSIIEVTGLGATLGGAVAVVIGAPVAVGSAIGIIVGAGIGAALGIFENEAAEHLREEYSF